MSKIVGHEAPVQFERKISQNKEDVTLGHLNEDKQAASDNRRNRLLSVIVLFLALGQWGDAVVVCERLYDEVVSNFTNRIEYEKLESIGIGVTKNYFYRVMGEPKVKRFSRVDKELVYEYFFHEKFLLNAIFREQRLEGYSVVSLDSGFDPLVPYQGRAVEGSSLASFSGKNVSSYLSDYMNIEFYIEMHELDKDASYMNQGIGFVNYSAQGFDYIGELRSIDEAAEEGDEKLRMEKIRALRDKLIPNMYSVIEVDPHILADSLLTKYEYRRFY